MLMFSCFNTMTNCFIKPSFISSEGKMIFSFSQVDHYQHCENFVSLYLLVGISIGGYVLVLVHRKHMYFVQPVCNPVRMATTYKSA